jgi:hypothetical protein
MVKWLLVKQSRTCNHIVNLILTTHCLEFSPLGQIEIEKAARYRLAKLPYIGRNNKLENLGKNEQLQGCNL